MLTTSFLRVLCHHKFVTIGVKFLAQMTSCIVHCDVTYHLLGVDGHAYANEFSNAYPEVYKKEGRLI